MPSIRAVLLVLVLGAAAVAADPAATLDELRAANRARADLAREAAAWTAERQRLEALVAATAAEAARLGREAQAAEAARDAGRARLVVIGSGGDLELLRGRLAEAATAAADRLRLLAATVPPGVVALGDDRSFDAVVRALEGAERAAGAVAVEVVTGQRDGRPEAVKLLRVAGAAAWWVSLDGRAAGTAAMRDGTLVLSESAQAEAIRQALAQAEGRAQPAIVVLP